MINHRKLILERGGNSRGVERSKDRASWDEVNSTL